MSPYQDNMLISIFVLITLVLVGQTAVFREIQELKSGDPPWCIDSFQGSVLSIYNIGETWYPSGICLKKECSVFGESKDKVEIVTYTCGVVDSPDHCLVSDLTKPYPECCPKLLKCCL